MTARCLLACLVLLIACQALVVQHAPAAEIIDWNRYDWRLDRALLVSRYLFHDRQPADPWGEYLQTLNDGIKPTAADIGGFLALDAGIRAKRRERADELMVRARLAILDRANVLRQGVESNSLNAIGDIMYETPGFGVAVTKALRRFDAALMQDPTIAEGWYHLAYFAGLVGDLSRADRGHEGFFAAWDLLSEDEQTTFAFYREQAILDRAWNLREAGRYAECLEWLETHRTDLDGKAEPPCVAPLVEALLIEALVHAELGEVQAALSYLKYLPLMKLPSRTAAPNKHFVHPINQRIIWYQQQWQANWNQSGSVGVFNKRYEMQDSQSENLAREHRESSYLRKWVKAWTSLRRGYDDETILRDMGRIELELEFQPRLAMRWWQDQGLIYEELGLYDLAQVCWARAAVYTPYFIYHPTGQGHGLNMVHGLPGTSQPYFLAYGTFFMSGSLWSYAANAALASEIEAEPREQAILRDCALARLDACIRRDIAAAEARAIRGRLSFLAEDYDAAETDLLLAWEELEAAKSDTTAGAPSSVALMLGLCRFNRDEWPGARPWLETFVRREPDAHVGWQALGMTQAFVGEPQLALASLDRAVELAPDNATYHYNRGLLNYRSGDRDAARRDFHAAQELWPENPQIIQMVAVVEEPTQYTLDMASTPVSMELPENQKTEIAQQIAAGAAASSVSDLSDLVTSDPEAQREAIENLRGRYVADPSEVNRLRLAEAATIAGRPDLVRDTLGPLWPDDLTRTERRLLLHADREEGDAKHAAELAGGLDWPGNEEDVELLTIAATILLDHDRRAEAAALVDRGLALQSGNAILQGMRRSLVNAP